MFCHLATDFLLDRRAFLVTCSLFHSFTQQPVHHSWQSEGPIRNWQEDVGTLQGGNARDSTARKPYQNSHRQLVLFLGYSQCWFFRKVGLSRNGKGYSSCGCTGLVLLSVLPVVRCVILGQFFNHAEPQVSSTSSGYSEN